MDICNVSTARHIFKLIWATDITSLRDLALIKINIILEIDLN
jgi:hypothetical protein